MSDVQLMLELTVIFGNPTIPNRVWLMEPDINDLYEEMKTLRETAESELSSLSDEQCFYRVFSRARPAD